MGEMKVQKSFVLLANRSRLMRELLRSLFTDQPDIGVMDDAEIDDELPNRVRTAHPHYLVVNSEDGTKACNLLLHEFRHLRILAIPTDKNVSTLYWLDGKIHSRKVATSAEDILRVLRTRGGRLTTKTAPGLQKAS